MFNDLLDMIEEDQQQKRRFNRRSARDLLELETLGFVDYRPRRSKIEYDDVPRRNKRRTPRFDRSKRM